MPPKASTLDITEASFNFIFSVLKHCEAIRPNWDEVAKENGITYGRNAAGRFRDIVRKSGYRFENGRILAGDDGTEAEAVPATPTPSKKPRVKKTPNGTNSPPLHGKKRKVVVLEDDDVEEDDGQAVKQDTGYETFAVEQEEQA